VLFRQLRFRYTSYSSSTIDVSTGITYTDYYDAFTVGAGYIDLQAALNDTNLVPSGYNAMSPAVSFDSTSQTVTFISDSSAVWGNWAV
jgi:serine protease AprX